MRTSQRGGLRGSSYRNSAAIETTLATLHSTANTHYAISIISKTTSLQNSSISSFQLHPFQPFRYLPRVMPQNPFKARHANLFASIGSNRVLSKQITTASPAPPGQRKRNTCITGQPAAAEGPWRSLRVCEGAQLDLSTVRHTVVISPRGRRHLLGQCCRHQRERKSTTPWLISFLVWSVMRRGSPKQANSPRDGSVSLQGQHADE